MKVAILYDGGSGDWSEADVAAVMANIREVRRSLRRLGHATTLVPVHLHDLKWLARLQRADLIFNLCEGINGHARYEDWAVGALELTGVPYTGCRASTVSICHRKHIANALLERAGVPIPAFGLGRRDQVPDGLRFPVIVKPSGEDASVGIEDAAICPDRDTALERVRVMAEQFDEVMVQEYVAGREFNVGFIGPDLMPLSEISFRTLPAGYWPIVSYSAKWREGTDEYRGTVPVCPAEVSAELRDRIAGVATRAWQLLGGEGYGRVDLRVTEDGSPYVLEVNPNPDLSSDAGFANMARARGWSYDALVGKIVDEVLSRPVARPASPSQATGAVA